MLDGRLANIEVNCSVICPTLISDSYVPHNRRPVITSWLWVNWPIGGEDYGSQWSTNAITGTRRIGICNIKRRSDLANQVHTDMNCGVWSAISTSNGYHLGL